MIKKTILALIWLFMGISLVEAQTDVYGEARLMNEKADGYRGIWYYIDNAGQAGKVTNQYRYKYSGGLGTYGATQYFPSRSAAPSDRYTEGLWPV